MVQAFVVAVESEPVIGAVEGGEISLLGLRALPLLGGVSFGCPLVSRLEAGSGIGAA